MKTVHAALLAILLLVPPAAVHAQAPPQDGPVELYELVLRDGSRIFGTIQSESDDQIVLRTTAGATVTASRGDIVSLRLVKGRMERGEFLRPDLHRTRLFFAPTARSLDQGEVSFGVFEFVAPFIQVGITDRIFRFADTLVGRAPGGLAQVNVFSSLIFSGMSGAALADVGGLGRIEIAAMRKRGFTAPFAAAVLAGAVCQGVIYLFAAADIGLAAEVTRQLGRPTPPLRSAPASCRGPADPRSARAFGERGGRTPLPVRRSA